MLQECSSCLLLGNLKTSRSVTVFILILCIVEGMLVTDHLHMQSVQYDADIFEYLYMWSMLRQFYHFCYHTELFNEIIYCGIFLYFSHSTHDCVKFI